MRSSARAVADPAPRARGCRGPAGRPAGRRCPGKRASSGSASRRASSPGVASRRPPNDHRSRLPFAAAPPAPGGSPTPRGPARPCPRRRPIPRCATGTRCELPRRRDLRAVPGGLAPAARSPGCGRSRSTTIAFSPTTRKMSAETTIAARNQKAGVPAARSTLGRSGGCRARRGSRHDWRRASGRERGGSVRERSRGHLGSLGGAEDRAARARFRATSSSDERSGFFVSTVRRSSSRNVVLTTRSSSEWYAITTTRPPGARSPTA